MTWQVFCAIYFGGELVILGPKCHTADCLEPVRFTVWWPGPVRFTVWWPGPAPIRCCDRCTEAWRRLAIAGLGFELATQPLYYTTGEDDAVQRFRNLELE